MTDRRIVMGLGLALFLAGCHHQPTQQAVAPPATPLVPVAATPPPPPPKPAPISVPTPPEKQLPNFHKVADNIYRGGAPTKDGLAFLKAHKVHTIIDLRIEKAHKDEQKLAEAMGFKWVGLPMGKEAPTAQQVQTFMDAIAKAPDEPLFVHCQHGSDRTGCMFGIYRAKVDHWSFDKIYAEMRKYDFGPQFKELKETVRRAAAG